jgi:hypothetical protein
MDLDEWLRTLVVPMEDDTAMMLEHVLFARASPTRDKFSKWWHQPALDTTNVIDLTDDHEPCLLIDLTVESPFLIKSQCKMIDLTQ